MRRRIRLTGRKQLNKSAIHVTLAEIGGKSLLTMTVKDPGVFKIFPTEANTKIH